MALILVMAVVPTLQIARMGVTEEIAYLLAGFKIHLSSDNAEVVRIVVYYMWCVEGELPRPHVSPRSSCWDNVAVDFHTLNSTRQKLEMENK